MLKLIFQFLKELYLTGFTLGFKVSKNSWSLGMNAGKEVLAVTLMNGAILMGIGVWIEIFVGTRFQLDSWTIRISALALYFANYYVLVTHGYGVKFEREFTRLKKSRKFLLLVSCAVLLLVTVVFSIYSVSAYHHFFHIVPKSGF